MTGHRPPAISYTGWQKLPEYALIRIAAGPKVADLPLCAHVQKSPISAPRPDGKSRRFAHVQSRHFSVCTCVQSRHFSDPRRKTFVQVVCGLVVTRRTKLFVAQKFSDARTSLCDVFVSVAQMCCFGMCTHSANVHTFRAHVLKIPVRVTSTPGTCALPRTHRAHRAQPKHNRACCSACCVHRKVTGMCIAPTSFGDFLFYHLEFLLTLSIVLFV